MLCCLPSALFNYLSECITLFGVWCLCLVFGAFGGLITPAFFYILSLSHLVYQGFRKFNGMMKLG